MRKNVLSTAPTIAPVKDYEWLDLETIATVQVSSEDPAFPVEAALSLQETGSGWRAAYPGEQKITILFDGPTLIHLIHLHFLEPASERTQQFTLRYSGLNGAMQEIARQQWNFSPGGSTSEVENLTVNLAGVLAIELVINPDIAGRNSVASLARFRFA